MHFTDWDKVNLVIQAAFVIRGGYVLGKSGEYQKSRITSNGKKLLISSNLYENRWIFVGKLADNQFLDAIKNPRIIKSTNSEGRLYFVLVVLS
jgi:hypothetical protein